TAAAASAATAKTATTVVRLTMRLISTSRCLLVRHRDPTAWSGTGRIGVSSAGSRLSGSGRYCVSGTCSVKTSTPFWYTSIVAVGPKVAVCPSAFVHLAVDVELPVTLNVTCPFCGWIGPDVPPDWPTTVFPPLFVHVNPADTLMVVVVLPSPESLPMQFTACPPSDRVTTEHVVPWSVILS